MRYVLAVLALLLVFPAAAQVIHRCRDASGVVSLQSAPCGADQRDLGARYYDTGTASPEALERRRQAEEAMQQRRQQASAPQGYSIGRPPHASDTRTQRRIQCDLARRDREVTLERLGNRRTFEMLRRLNEAVYEACKGL